jgi:hypothetical protein
MSNVLEKELIKPQGKPPRKFKIGKFNLAMTILTIVSIGLIINAIYSHMSFPNTYDELEPMMEEAILFDQKAAELSGQYASIEDQIGEDAYFAIKEEDYQNSGAIQQEMINDIQVTNQKIQEAGGITTYEELQRVRKPATNSFDAKMVAKEFGDDNYNQPAQTAASTSTQGSAVITDAAGKLAQSQAQVADHDTMTEDNSGHNH